MLKSASQEIIELHELREATTNISLQEQDLLNFLDLTKSPIAIVFATIQKKNGRSIQSSHGLNTAARKT